MFKLFVDKQRAIKAVHVDVSSIDMNIWQARMSKGNGWYIIRFFSEEKKFICGCKDHQERGAICKHIIAVIRKYTDIVMEFKK